MKIAVLCGGTYVFGLEKMALAVVRGLRMRGHDVRCLVSGWNDGRFTSRLEEYGVPYQTAYLGKISLSTRPQYVLWTLSALAHMPRAIMSSKTFLEDFDPDVVLAYNRDTIVYLRNVLADRPTAYHVHDVPRPTMGACLMNRLASSVVDHLIAVSESVAFRLIESGTDAGKVSVVYNGIPHAQRALRPGQGRKVLVGIVGQVGEWKGHDDLLEALRLLVMRDCEIACRIAGVGPEGYARALRRKVAHYRLEEHVEWCGYVEDASAIYEGLDICVVPSRFEEPFGLVAVEAGLRGIPVVATRVGGLPEIVIDGQTGLLVEPKDPQGLADAIETLAEEPESRRRMGDAARQRMQERFGVDRMVTEIERILLDTAAK